MSPTPTPQWNTIVEGCVQDGAATLNCIPALFSNVINALWMLTGITSLVIFLMAGFKYMNSAGDPKKLEGARNNLIWGSIGLTIVILSFFLINIISYVTGIPCITKFGFGC